MGSKLMLDDKRLPWRVQHFPSLTRKCFTLSVWFWNKLQCLKCLKPGTPWPYFGCCSNWWNLGLWCCHAGWITASMPALWAISTIREGRKHPMPSAAQWKVKRLRFFDGLFECIYAWRLTHPLAMSWPSTAKMMVFDLVCLQILEANNALISFLMVDDWLRFSNLLSDLFSNRVALREHAIQQILEFEVCFLLFSSASRWCDSFWGENRQRIGIKIGCR